MKELILALRNIVIASVAAFLVFVSDYNSVQIKKFQDDIRISSQLSNIIYDTDEYKPCELNGQKGVFFKDNCFLYFNKNGLGGIGTLKLGGSLYVVFRGTNPFSLFEIYKNISCKLLAKVLLGLMSIFLILKASKFFLEKIIKTSIDQASLWKKRLFDLYKVFICISLSFLFVNIYFLVPDNNISSKETVSQLRQEFKLIEKNYSKDMKIIFTGHSKGASEAQYFFENNSFTTKNLKLVTFGGQGSHSKIKNSFAYSTSLDFVQKLVDNNDSDKKELLWGGWFYLCVFLFILAHILYFLKFSKVIQVVFSFLAILYFVVTTHSMSLYNALVTHTLW